MLIPFLGFKLVYSLRMHGRETSLNTSPWLFVLSRLDLYVADNEAMAGTVAKVGFTITGEGSGCCGLRL